MSPPRCIQVCDCGHEASSAVPVVDGFVLNRAVQRGIRGGAWVTRQTYEFLTVRGYVRRGDLKELSPSLEGGSIDTAATFLLS